MIDGHRRVDIALGFFVFVSYLSLSVWRGSLCFWDWRKIQFDSFTVTDADQDYAFASKNQGPAGEAIMVAGHPYHDAIATHANSNMRIHVKIPSKRLRGGCAYPDWARGASIRCRIIAGQRTLFESEILSSSHPLEMFDVDIEGQDEVNLLVRSARDDITAAHAVWVAMELRN